ncbi:hypothetical protein H4S04_005123 [Coemansia sp. S16]|nr:hypothetical protein H4S03_002476 [Coemansia sp. S3946]KAJ2046296.1 hypothetical protein H4S04_005123 [Coemansia sp. S16]KAJ2084466.1 hypothetical protein GGI09_007252 [Coemansia sp. S100]KAJ2340899.1 hypothetical protein GGH92_006055 [Coemansia sp. RSA 2673]
MDVTRDNFGQALAEFRLAISTCDFAAIDLEMTGLYEDRARQPSHLDTKDDRYFKLFQSVQSYGVIQVGICLFSWVDSKSDEPKDGGYYEARPFNFNVFPCTSVAGFPVEAHFGCKNTAFEFLARNSFDFNKWVYQGIPFLNADQADRIRADRVSLLTKRQPQMEVNEQHKPFVKTLETTLRKFMKTKGERQLRYDTANSYERKLVYDVVARHNTLGTRSRHGCIEIFKGTRKAMARHVAQKIHALNASIEDARGFCQIIDILSAARKPVVGHNMLLDVMHAHAKFYKPLPATRRGFGSNLSRFLPILIDTKYIIESTPAIKARYRTSNLDEIAPMLERESMRSNTHGMIRNHPQFTRDVTHTMHEAGFDAYMTGATFIRLLNLEGELDLSAAPVSSELVLYRYINRLYVALGDALYWNLTEDSAKESRAWRAANSHAKALGDDVFAVDSATSLSDDSCSADEDDQSSSSADASFFDDLAPELDALSLRQ